MGKYGAKSKSQQVVFKSDEHSEDPMLDVD